MKNDHLITLAPLSGFNSRVGNAILPKDCAKGLKIDTVVCNKKSLVIVNNTLTDSGASLSGNTLKKTGMPEINGSISIRGFRVVVERAGKTAPGHVTTAYAADLDNNRLTNYKTIPLPTFMVGVDKASSANSRCFTNTAFVEELINYFNHNLPKPADGEPVAIKSEIATAPWANRIRWVSNATF